MLSPFSNAETRTLETQSLVSKYTCQVMETSETKSPGRGRKNELWTIRFLALIRYKCRSIVTCGHTIKILGKQNMKTHVTPVNDHSLPFSTLPILSPACASGMPACACSSAHQVCTMPKHTPLRSSHPFPHLAFIYFAPKKVWNHNIYPFAITFPLLAQICRSREHRTFASLILWL